MLQDAQINQVVVLYDPNRPVSGYCQAEQGTEEAGTSPKDPLYQEMTYVLGSLHPNAASTDSRASSSLEYRLRGEKLPAAKHNAPSALTSGNVFLTMKTVQRG